MNSTAMAMNATLRLVYSISPNYNSTVYSNDSGPVEHPTEMSTFQHVSSFIYMYLTPVFILIGTTGNIISCIALRRPPLNTFSPAVYLMFYAISAMLIFSLVIGVEWCLEWAEVQYLFTPSQCRLWEFTRRIITYSGQWFIVGSAIDRFVVLWFPSRSNDICTVFMAKVGCILIIISLVFVSVHALWMAEISVDRRYCYVHSTMEEDLFIWLWILVSGLISGLIPQMILFVLGNLLVIRLCLKHRGRQIPDTAALDIDLTYTTMAISLLFFLNVPATIANHLVMMPSNLDDMALRETHEAIYEVTNLLVWFTYSGLFFTLFAFSKSFRESVRGMFVSCVMIFNRGSTPVELTVLSDEYDQVPSTSTSL